MTTTELKYWLNGYTVHGGNFKQYALSIGKLGVVLILTPQVKQSPISLYYLK